MVLNSLVSVIYGGNFKNCNLLSDEYHWTTFLSQCWPSCMSPYDVTRAQWVNTLTSGINGHHFADGVFEFISMDKNCWILTHISLQFDFKGLSHCLDQWWPSADACMRPPISMSLPLIFLKKTTHLRIAVYRNMRVLIQLLYFEVTGVTLLPNSITSRHIKCHGNWFFLYTVTLSRSAQAFELVGGSTLIF